MVMKVPIEVGKDVRFRRSCSFKWLQVAQCGSYELSQHILDVWQRLIITEPTQRPWIRTSESLKKGIRTHKLGKKPLKSNQALVSDHEEDPSVVSPLLSPQVYVPTLDSRQQPFSPHYIDFLVQSSLRGTLDSPEATSSSPLLFMVSILDLSMAVSILFLYLSIEAYSVPSSQQAHPSSLVTCPLPPSEDSLLPIITQLIQWLAFLQGIPSTEQLDFAVSQSSVLS